MSNDRIKDGDMVRCGVYVCGEWKPSSNGRVVSLNCDGTLADVDIMSHHGGRPWIVLERTDHLRKIESPNEWNGLDSDARSNLRDSDLAEFFRYRDSLKQEGRQWLHDAQVILTGWIWDKVESYEDGGASD